MKIGILGGTFDPIHYGHLILAQEAAQQLKLDKVVFVPAYIPVHKMKSCVLNPRHRYKMVKLAVKNNYLFEVSDIEIRSKKPCYTVDTLRKLKNRFKNDRLYFITGSDNVSQFPKWKDPQGILKFATLAIAKRPGSALKGKPKKSAVIKMSPVDISSSQLRSFIKSKRSIEFMVPEPVRRYITKHRLYPASRRPRL